MASPSISVLVPVFNGEKFLAECLESILTQDFGDFELIIGDDGSKDDSADIIEHFARRDSRIRWWRNPRNLGIGGNFNACLQAARGDYVKYVLQDDKFLAPSALRRMLTVLQADSSVTLAASAGHLIDAESRVIGARDGFRVSSIHGGREVIARCLAENFNLVGEPSLTLFPRQPAARGFNAGFKQWLDLEMWFYLLEQGRFAYLAEPLCAFRQHPAQQTEVNRRQGAGEDEDLILQAQYFAKPWIREEMTSRQLFAKAYSLRKRPDPKAAALADTLAEMLGRPRYAAWWLEHKLTRPFLSLRRWLKRQGFAGRAPSMISVS